MLSRLRNAFSWEIKGVVACRDGRKNYFWMPKMKAGNIFSHTK
jgi:hypothetical protein